ncbi:MAG: bifunctional 3-demethylubiquinol 3-O-methyltransferase/2-polyprenyl-6-hydroxyphenol methylase, partial [Gammaproteobacteria bacterium]
LFLSTINRNLRSYLGAVVAAEYLFGLLPRGTHDYARFIRPSELAAWLRAANLTVVSIRGMVYLPLVNRAVLTDRPTVNYLVHARRGD